MSRPIKFRAWDTDSQQWLGATDLMYLAIWGIGLDAGLLRYPGGVMLQQFIGLQDRKGVDIYEGDIVANLGFFRGEVIFDDGIFTSEDRAGYYIDLKANGRWRDFKQLEVVGNIYENPKLINNKQEN